MAKRMRSKHSSKRGRRRSRESKKMFVFPVEGGWAIREGDDVSSPYEKQRDAVNAALLRAGDHDVEVSVHNEKGRLIDRAVHSRAEQAMFRLWNDIYHHPEKYNF